MRPTDVRCGWSMRWLHMLGLLSLCVHVATASSPMATTIEYSFDKARAGGVLGSIHVVYPTPSSTLVTILADIDMRALNMTQVHALHPSCGHHIKEYKWYLVVNEMGMVPIVGFLDKCDHLDFTRVVAPPTIAKLSALFVDDTTCTRPTSVAKDRLIAAHESRHNVNLSHQLGRLVVEDGRISQAWHNVSFPAYGHVTPRWSIVLHAVCGDSSPPVVCAQVDFELKVTNRVQEAHALLGIASFVVASSLLLFLT
ncbi:hypothetical protein SDRG_04922 [Saprolegnia diclina VS20]|uniref:Uncharacterized protein n=1 Tax=Saprolegnia diclina (strain VS20) TaxID=1156394 RepID=T0QIT5_SAPDV|nr:hypothetical protein SDRG_04922 [Saprolegnia diclina VS20]EQC37904.1 hypothetical protein SDRG_04922 [Saprolegnia diclina VS20]|eukprot:XP_008608837.1 hypothetical protein SDRG_04922 [Saprolegnia diclina VS20]